VIAPSAIHAGDSVASKAQDDLRVAYTNVAGRRSTERIGAELAGVS